MACFMGGKTEPRHEPTTLGSSDAQEPGTGERSPGLGSLRTV